jgi:hypothetical protein
LMLRDTSSNSVREPKLLLISAKVSISGTAYGDGWKAQAWPRNG